MAMSQRPWSARRSWAPYRVILPGVAGAMLLGATLFPWFNDPAGTRLSPWQLPIELGWQWKSSLFNYGLLCALCSLYIFFLTRQSWLLLRAQRRNDPVGLLTIPSQTLASRYRRAGLLCLLPPLLFLFQFLFADMSMIAVIARNQFQLELTRLHLGYQASPEFLPILPFTLHPAHITGRLAMLYDQVGIGYFMPLITVVMLWIAPAFLRRQPLERYQGRRRYNRSQRLWLAGLALVGCILLGRAPAALFSQYQATHYLNVGDYDNTLKWLDLAHFLNPGLNDLVDDHIIRGQAWYFLHPQQPTAESQAYLSTYYQNQNDVYTAYQEMESAWDKYPHTPWLRDALSVSLSHLAETTKPLRGIPQIRLSTAEPALPWLTELVTLDNTNFYAHFTIGRILYELHDYAGSEDHMRRLLHLNQNPEMQSAAYTYISLSRFGLGDFANAREYLYKAQDFDPSYRNNTARQFMSGMR